MKRLLFVLAIVSLFAITLVAQTSTGRLTGTVSGPDGVLPGATVVLKDKKTGKELTATTNEEGSYTFTNLDYGDYEVRSTATGFKTAIANITIQVAQQYSLSVSLEIGNVSESVTVTAGADLINSTNAELSSTITNRQITELPLAARNPLSLILTQAGSASNPSQGTSINGGRTSSTNITRDGVNIQDNFIRSNATDFAPGRPSVDNVEEFTLTSQSSADSGFGSAQVTLVTPRGGNEFHGGAWEYNRNSALSANSFFANAGGSYAATNPAVISGFRKAGEAINPRPFRNRNQYGAKVSGPIWKDRIFFFAFAERLKDIVQAGRVITVLTDTARQGIWRYSSGGTIYSANIFCANCFTTNAQTGKTPPTGINSLVQSTFLAGMPVGNSFEVGDGLNTTGYRFFQQANSDRDALTGRVDYDVNSQNNVNFVIDYNFEQNLRNDVDTVSVTPKVLQPARNVVYSGGWRYSPTASISNEFRIGRFYSQPDFFRTDEVGNELYVPGLISSVIPTFLNQGRQVKTINLQDTVSWLVGNHSVRMGAQYQNVWIQAYNDAGIKPLFSFGIGNNGPVLTTALAATAGGPALTAPQATSARSLFALLGGVIGSGQQAFNVTSQDSGYVSGATNLRGFKFSNFAPYVLDQWKATQALTLNFGLRYDYQTPLESTNGLYWEPTIADGRDPVEAALDPAGTFQFIGGNSGKANTFYKKDLNNWAPSFGVAWAPKDIENKVLRFITGEDFVIRGGYRKSFVNDELVRAPDNALGNHPGFSTTTAALTTYNVTQGVTNLLDERFGTPIGAVATSGTFTNVRNFTTNNTTAFNRTGTVFAIDPELQVPSQNDYQVSVQRRFGKWVAEARYVGGFSKNMLRTIDYNQISIPDAYRTDFNTVRANVLAGCASNAACAAGAPSFIAMASSGGVLANNAFGTLVRQGQIAELAWQQIVAGNISNPNVVPYPTGTTQRELFLKNPNAGVVNVLENGGSYYYNAGQFEIRRQINAGLYLQANYTFSKELTDAIGTAQARVEPFLDNNNRGLDYTRADYDQTHVFNVNSIYELPFGKGRKFLSNAGWLDHVIGGWQLGLVLRVSSGAPITFTDARGTLNRAGRSGRQTALTNLTEEELRANIGVYRTQCGIFFVNPAVININQANLQAGNCTALNTGVTAGTVGGAASSGFGEAQFPGQIFFNNGAGQTGSLRRAIVNGPWATSADVSLLKNFRITERVGFQIRGEAYNFTNTPYFAPGQTIDINSTSFGRITGVAVGARVVQVAGRLNF